MRKDLPCGTSLSFEYGLGCIRDRYVRKMTRSVPSGRERVTEVTRECDDRDSNHVTDLTTEEITTDGKLSRYVTDDLAFTKTLTTPEGREVVTHYDNATGLTGQVSIQGLNDTEYAYHADGRLASVTVGSRVTSFVYDTDAHPRTVTVTDPGLRNTTYEYDSMMRLTNVRRPDGSEVGFDYDRNGNMTVLWPPSEFQHTFGYNGTDRNDSYVTPLENTYAYVYDKDRRLTEKHFPSGKLISYFYEGGKLDHIQTPEGSTDFSYEPCGTKVESVSRNGEAITYAYDGSLVTSETMSGTLGQSIVYVYNNDPSGDHDLIADGLTYAGGTESYAYDDDGLLTGSGDFTVGRNEYNGLPDTVTGGSLSLTRSFNGYGETDGEDFQVGSGSVMSWQNDLRHDDGRIRRKTEVLNGVSHVYEYAYDDMGRLLTVTKDGVPDEEYGYDDFGRRDYEMSVPGGITGRTLAYDDEDRLMSVGGVTYDYDDDGFLQSKTDGPDVTEYAYSSQGGLLSVTLPDSTVIRYLHDPLGRRIAKEVDGTITEKYLWQGLTRLLAVYNADDTLRMRFEYADARMPVAMTRGAATYYLG